jgi:coproporphyrinogen III oxidase
MMDFKEKVKDAFKSAQTKICNALAEEDGGAFFSEEHWSHHDGGGGITRVITNGKVFEKGGVNFSAVDGNIPHFMKTHVNPDATRFFATGISIVIHPESPMVPIIHMNVRYFQTDAGDAWFGGGIDLTPIYILDKDARFFHEELKRTCDRYHPSFYSRFKDWADEYFFNEHRQETRGIGGIFYDYIKPDAENSQEELLQFAVDLTDSFLTVYLPLVREHKQEVYNATQKEWQLIRRGRYVEFNLVYDRGTRFGLETRGRIESILMSLPEYATWKYQHQPAIGSPEEQTLSKLKKGLNWLNES